MTSEVGSAGLEPGAVFEATHGRGGGGDAESFDVIVIGAGQAGLSVGWHLARMGVRFVILDAHPKVGDAWRSRWDSLHLFSTARYDGLAGMPFPGDPDRFPTKDEMADYLEAYVARFALPVRTGARVERVTREHGRYVVLAGGRRLEAAHVVVAMSSYQSPRIPAFARELDPSIAQLHTLDYRRPSQLPDGDVLVVGAGNSGAEIAMDLLAAGRRVHLSGRIPGQVPFDVRKRWVRRTILRVLFRGVFHRVLTVDTPIGRRARPKFMTGGTPLIRTRSRDLEAAGVVRVGRTTGARNGRPLLADGRVLDVHGIVWCTGFALGGGWVDLPVFDDHGEPVTEKGIVPGEPGLYFVGTHFVYAVSSAMVHGVGRDAARITAAIAARLGRPAIAA